MFLLSKLVRDSGFKVVMTGEGADEFLGGYDIFKEMKVRRFWAKDPESTLRSKLLFKLYPDINRINASGAFLVGFFKRGLLEVDSPYYSHLTRWNNTARTWRFLANKPPHNEAKPVFSLPVAFKSWSALGQAQYLEITTFLSSYLLSSQGDRMAMGHSVEGRYPFLDFRMMEFCGKLPPEQKMPVLIEKWLLKQLGKKYLPDTIWKRTKRPYRAPIHRSFFLPKPLDYVDDLLSETAIKDSGLFEPKAVQMLIQKAQNGLSLSEIEDMALVGIISAQLVHRQFIRGESPSPKSLINNRIRYVDHATSDHV
jgi:asparagine synthase (glutamine-hydrolysing)